MNSEQSVRFDRMRKALAYTQPRVERWEKLAMAGISVIGGIVAVAKGISTLLDTLDPPSSDED